MKTLNKLSTLMISILLGVAGSSAQVSEDGTPGVLHTKASERMLPGEIGASFYTWWTFDEDDLFKNDSLYANSDTNEVKGLFATENTFGLAVGLPYGFALGLKLPLYTERFDWGSDHQSGLFLGDMSLNASWSTSPKKETKETPWTFSASIGTNLPTATTGQGYLVRELEYAYSEEGCYLYSCGSRNTGLQFRNISYTLGSSYDLSKSSFKKPAKVHTNLQYRSTAPFSPEVGPYELQNTDVYDILNFKLAGEYAFYENVGVIAEYNHDKRLHSDFSYKADKHQLSYAGKLQPSQDLHVIAGLSHGILNNGYAKGMYVRDDGSKVRNFHFKTPDIQFFAGVTWSFGKQRDQDQDGVTDKKDKCPQTPPKTQVDWEGCAEKDIRDADHDGVPDDQDECPNTPRGVEVDKKGCALDSDKDGVPDYKDKCPGTPAGVSVDENGCPLDTDKDGVIDIEDQCPNTLRGLKVDKVGCPFEAEKDLSKLQRQINFEVGSAKLTKASLPVLDNLAELLKEFDDVKLEVQGHTDNDGSRSMNMDLSQRRAQSVVDYLVKKGIKKRRLTAKGYGFDRPIASNATKEGKRKNRRVELVPID